MCDGLTFIFKPKLEVTLFIMGFIRVLVCHTITAEFFVASSKSVATLHPSERERCVAAYVLFWHIALMFIQEL